MDNLIASSIQGDVFVERLKQPQLGGFSKAGYRRPTVEAEFGDLTEVAALTWSPNTFPVDFSKVVAVGGQNISAAQSWFDAVCGTATSFAHLAPAPPSTVRISQPLALTPWRVNCSNYNNKIDVDSQGRASEY